MVVWNALFAPKGTPPGDRREAELRPAQGHHRSGLTGKFLQLGAEPPPESQRSPQALRQIHASDVAKWGEVIRGANITVE